VVGLADPAKAVQLLQIAKAETGGGVDAFELMGRLGIDFTLKNVQGTRDFLEGRHPWYVLIELASGEAGAAEAAMERVLADAFERELIADAAIAQNLEQAKAFWRVREEHSSGQKPEGAAWKHDVSVPISRIPEFITEASTALEQRFPGVRIVAFGHVGDGNVHYDAIQPEGGDGKAFGEKRDEGSKIVHDIVARYHGSISAEHGLGRMKTAEGASYKSEVELDLQRAVRSALDPKRIMNPRVLF
jgi:FAD/FMN-containing dehydrogenase